jgi:F-type H+-transporting ATPase subunit epsilon
MPKKTFKLDVITPDRVVISADDVTSVVAPGVEGYLGVLANHSPLMTALEIGRLDFKRADGSVKEMAISGGFMEVHNNTVTVLAEAAEQADEIDLERAERAAKRAEERLGVRDKNIDIERAQAALQRALNRLEVARRAR